MSKNIALIGMLGLFILLMLSLFFLQKTPKVKEIQNLSRDIKIQFDLETILITRVQLSQKIVYRVMITPSSPVEGVERHQLLQDIGEYFFKNFSLYPPPDEVTIIYHKTFGGCSFKSQTESLTIQNKLAKSPFSQQPINKPHIPATFPPNKLIPNNSMLSTQTQISPGN